MPQFQRMVGKGPELERYDEYLQYVDAGEPQGVMGHAEWLAIHNTPEPAKGRTASDCRITSVNSNGRRESQSCTINHLNPYST